jgi:hypothetical protein
MSTKYGLVCRSHIPHIHSRAVFAEPEPLRWVYRHRHELVAWLNLANELGSVVAYPELEGCIDGRGSLELLAFLGQHFRCSLGIYTDEGNPLGPTIEPLSDRPDKAPDSYEQPQRVDPPGCRCTDCLVGDSRPATKAEWRVVEPEERSR